MTIYPLSHLMQPWMLPPGLNLLMIITGIGIGYYWQKLGKWIVVIGCMSLWLLSAPIVAYNLIDLLQNQYPILQADQLKISASQDAIVILGGGDTVEAEYGDKHTVSDFTLHRIDYGAYLYQKTHLPVIVSGGKTLGAQQSEADLMAKVLKDDFNITVNLKEDKSFSTADEGKLIASLLKQHGFKIIYLVTDAWHMPRSVFIFRCAGVKVIPAPMGQYVYGPGYALISYLPNIDALYASSLAIHEWIGLAWYHWRYGNQCVA